MISILLALAFLAGFPAISAPQDSPEADSLPHLADGIRRTQEAQIATRGETPGDQEGTAEPQSPTASGGAPAPVGTSRISLLLDRPTLTGDWGGIRTDLEKRGVTFSLFLNDQFQAVAKGGVESNGSGQNAASIDGFVILDFEKLGCWKNADALLHFQSNWGNGINDRTGALYEVNDDADEDLGLHVAQLWYRHHFFERKLSLMLGFLDYQTIVDRNAFANSEDKQFWNQTLDNNPLVPLNIGLGAALTFQPTKWYTLIAGVGDAQSVLYKPGFSTAFHEEAYFVAYLENGLRVELPGSRGPLTGNYRLGTFYDPRPRGTFERPRRAPSTEDDYGVYVSVDQMVYRESSASDQGLGVFGRFGYRHPEVNRVNRFWSGGLSYKGLVPGRDEDVLGFGFSLARGSSIYHDVVNDAFDQETVYELYYAIQATKWCVITPDVQYVINPGAAGDVGHTIVAGIRTRISF